MAGDESRSAWGVVGRCTFGWVGATDVASESIVEPLLVSLLMIDDRVEDVDLQRLVADAESSTVAIFGLSFEGVLGFELLADFVGLTSSFPGSRTLVLDLEECSGRSFPRSLALEPARPSFLFRSSACFCRSVPLRSFLTVSLLTFSIVTFGSMVVSGGLGGARCGGGRFVVSLSFASDLESLPRSRSVGSGV